MRQAGTLYLVATPIGNLKDITLRALEVLKEADLIACEDTRHTRKLLNHYGIKNRLISYHEHNEALRSEELAAFLEQCKNVALVSDAGTPGISDPGFRIVQKAHELSVRVVPIPGPAAFVSALIASGLPTDSIFYGGFLPPKKGERRKRLAEVASIPATLVFYESPRRLARALQDCLDVLGDRNSAIARELTKIHEELKRGKLSELIKIFGTAPVKGEIVLLIESGKSTESAPPNIDLASRIRELEREGIDHKTALKKAAKEFGLNRSEAYRQYSQARNNR